MPDDDFYVVDDTEPRDQPIVLDYAAQRPPGAPAMPPALPPVAGYVPPFICPICRYHGHVVRKQTGSVAVVVLLILFLFPVGIWYLLTSYKMVYVCPHCGFRVGEVG